MVARARRALGSAAGAAHYPGGGPSGGSRPGSSPRPVAEGQVGDDTAAQGAGPGAASKPASSSSSTSSTGRRDLAELLAGFRPIPSTGLRLLVSYIQVISQVKNVGLRWPQWVLDMFAVQQQVSPTPGMVASLDCLLHDTRTTSAAVQRTLITTSLAACYLLAGALLWMALAMPRVRRAAQQRQRQRHRLQRAASKRQQAAAGQGQGKPLDGEVEPMEAFWWRASASLGVAWRHQRSRIIITLLASVFYLVRPPVVICYRMLCCFAGWLSEPSRAALTLPPHPPPLSLSHASTPPRWTPYSPSSPASKLTRR